MTRGARDLVCLRGVRVRGSGAEDGRGPVAFPVELWCAAGLVIAGLSVGCAHVERGDEPGVGVGVVEAGEALAVGGCALEVGRVGLIGGDDLDAAEGLAFEQDAGVDRVGGCAHDDDLAGQGKSPRGQGNSPPTSLSPEGWSYR